MKHRKIKVTTPRVPRVDPDDVAKALGAERVTGEAARQLAARVGAGRLRR